MGCDRDMKEKLAVGDGILNLEQISLRFDGLPVEITFADENDIIRYYSNPKRILFTRKPEIISTTVQSCLAPGSRPMVDQIVDTTVCPVSE